MGFEEGAVFSVQFSVFSESLNAEHPVGGATIGTTTRGNVQTTAQKTGIPVRRRRNIPASFRTASLVR
jgi:hypothetical protein